MTQALHAEWTKLWTTSRTTWLLLGAIALTVALSAGIAATTHVSGDRKQDPTELSLIGIDLGQAVVAIVAIMTIAEEYGTGLIQVSLTAVPRRLLLLSAKIANVAALTLIVGIGTVGGCLLVGRLILPGAGLDANHGYSLVSLSHEPTLRAAIGSVLYLVLIALLALGIATAVRDSAISIGIVLGLLYGLPLLAQLVRDPIWHRHLGQVTPMLDFLAIQTTTNVHNLPIGPWEGLGVVAVWAAVALFIGGVALCVRDA